MYNNHKNIINFIHNYIIIRRYNYNFKNIHDMFLLLIKRCRRNFNKANVVNIFINYLISYGYKT